MTTTQKNPITGDDLRDDQIERLDTLRLVMRNAKAANRSGNPAKREPAKRVLRALPGEFRKTYLS